MRLAVSPAWTVTFPVAEVGAGGCLGGRGRPQRLRNGKRRHWRAVP